MSCQDTSISSIYMIRECLWFDFFVTELSVITEDLADEPLPWLSLFLFQVIDQGTKNKVHVIGTTSINLAEFASAGQKEFELNTPLTNQGGSSDYPPSLYVRYSTSLFILKVFVNCKNGDFLQVLIQILQLSMSLTELSTSQATMDPDWRAIVPVSDASSGGEPAAAEKDELSVLKAGIRRVKIFTEHASVRRAKKDRHDGDSSEGRFSGKGEDGECNYPYDSDSHNDSEGGESEEGKESSYLRKSFSYGTLAYANYVGGSFYSNRRIGGKDEDWVYYSYRISDGRSSSQNEDPVTSISQQAQLNSPKLGILSWRKRKLGFRSPKARGEPLLKKAYAEDGGDDIDFDRRQLSSDESLAFGVRTSFLSFFY